MTEMLLDKEYQLIAKKILYNTCNPELSEAIYNDEDYFGSIASAIMIADWKWDGRGTIYGYRKQYAKWTIYRIIKEINSNKREHNIRNFSSFEFSDFYDKTQKDFVEEIEQQDYIQHIKYKIENSKLLVDNEKYILISKFLNDSSISEIAETLQIRVEAVRQALTRAMTKIGKSLCVC